jgi:hypothetical protein
MIKKTLTALVLSGAFASAQAGVLLDEGFNNVYSLTSSGWVLTNASMDVGLVPTWSQGSQDVFNAQSGAANSFAAANYNNATAGGTLNNWLITPEFNTETGVVVSLWLRAEDFAPYSDNIAFGFSNGSAALADFKLDPSFTVPTDGWTHYTLTLGAQGAGAKGRFAIQYNGLADASDYVGLDTLQVTSVPEPATIFVMATGLAGLAAARRRRRQG